MISTAIRRSLLLIFFFLITGSAVAQTHHIFVAAESDDEVYEIAFNSESQEGKVVDVVPVGEYPTETEGPHGINVGLDGEYWYVSVAHGTPYGWLYKFKTGTNEFVERTELGMFPASLEISKATGMLFVVNFNLHGDLEPSTVSVVDPAAMQVVENIKTGIMPHGSRITDDGKYQYHVSMMTDELVEINTTKMKVTRRLNVAKGEKTASSENNGKPKPQAKPTWADPHPTKDLIYVANNGSDSIVEVNTDKWKITRRFKTGKAPYNLEVSNNGKYLVASYKGEGATGIWNLESGKEVAKIKNSRNVTHGVTISPNSKYAFISVEGIGGQPGSVDIINLETLKRVDVVEVGKQAGGIIHWKTTQ